MERRRSCAREVRAWVANSYKVQGAVNSWGFRSMQIPNEVRVWVEKDGGVGVDEEGEGEGQVGLEEEELGQGRTRGTVSQPVGDSCAQVSSV